ncbi:thioredoxin [Haloarcula nitratireducens]|uniref:Thioredoxin n=1 Tax=Haloarcula nitratireducens TaxID=2487749 RepID=A0AAW4PF23_9EURY|nr:thioredoxin [Halomicroarcula nitratireducens]MBX0296509.1 thioredoxin [Halomicroarcula nitratireducens]
MSEDRTLETLKPNPVWVEDAYDDTVDALRKRKDELEYHIWGGDWCIDCRAQLPDFGAALEAAGIPEERVHQYPVGREDDGSKLWPKVEAYKIELIPTVIVERDDEEVARFVEEEPIPIAVHLVDQLEESEE